MIPAALAGVLVDNAAFNARYGDHSINLAATYELRKRVAPFVAVTTDGRDADLSAGWSPANPDKRAFVAFEASAGNGFLARPEERQQYKMNAARTWERGNHEVTAFGIGYYGFSRIPGLIPFDAPVASDTIDPRQADLTHTTLALVTDRWRSSAGRTLQSSAYFRTYSIDLRSDFGAGLIRQSEFRTVAGGNAMYTQVLSRRWTGLAGVDVRRDAPRELDLALADAGGVFRPVTSNDLTIIDSAAFVAVNGNLNRSVHVYGGVRRDQISFVNGNRLSPEASFRAWPGTTSPKASITFGREDAPVLPEISFSFGKAFHANDPRIGNGAAEGSAGGAMQAMRGDLIIHAREYQLVATKLIEGTEVRVTLAHITNSAELAKIDPDTGLQQNLGPSVNRYVTVAVRHRYDGGFVQVSYSQADAVDRELHQPLPEAPRLIVDAVGTMDRLPWGMHAKSEFTYVGEKPLGDGFRSVPVREIRLNLARSFGDGRWIASVNGELARGHTGQTLETLALPGEGAAFERVVGVPLRSYASGSLQYQFGH